MSLDSLNMQEESEYFVYSSDIYLDRWIGV